MPDFTISAVEGVSDAEALALYAAVGWTAYTRNPQVLMRALRNSSFVVAARDGSGRLVGLARAISDDATICYVQDILVEPAFQGSGIGRQLLEAVQVRFGHIRQTVLLTDDESGQRAFYEAWGSPRARTSAPDRCGYSHSLGNALPRHQRPDARGAARDASSSQHGRPA